MPGGGRAVLPTPLGPVGVLWVEGALVSLSFLPDAPLAPPQDGLGAQVARELAAYFAHPNGHCWRVPYRLLGTDFQQRVWQALAAIPMGETRSYGTIARQLASGARAVGSACRTNPLPLLIPCHRVVAQSGLGGYDGAMQGTKLDRKRWLLRHEGIDLSEF